MKLDENKTKYFTFEKVVSNVNRVFQGNCLDLESNHRNSECRIVLVAILRFLGFDNQTISDFTDWSNSAVRSRLDKHRERFNHWKEYRRDFKKLQKLLTEYRLKCELNEFSAVLRKDLKKVNKTLDEQKIIDKIKAIELLTNLLEN